MDKQIVNLMNTQIKKELESAYLYFSFASYFDEKGLSGFAQWFKIQAAEEEKHAIKFYDYLHERNQKVIFFQISAPEQKNEEIYELLSIALNHERYITSSINEIYKFANETNDYASIEFLSWFIKEQLEEESNAQKLLNKYEFISNSQEGLYLLDKELGKREN